MKRHPSTSSWIICVVLFLSGCGGMNSNMMSPSLKITTPNAPSGATTVQYNGKNGLTLAATGGTPPYTWSWAPAPNSDLPPGLNLRDNSISGTPQVTGDFRVLVTVTDSGHPAAEVSATYTVSVNAPLNFSSGLPPNTGIVGTGYGPIGTIYLKCVWSSTGGVHQVCSRCDPAISGSCPANRTNCSYPQTCTRAVQGHAGFTFTATGGAAPYIWSGKGLPPGLGLYPRFGIMSGTPTTVGTYNITVNLKDSEPVPQQTQTVSSIRIVPAGHYALNGVCYAFAGASTRGICSRASAPVACPVGALAKTLATLPSCASPSGQLVDTSRPCTAGKLPGHCVVTSTGASAH